jgi:hypothetical protein
MSLDHIASITRAAINTTHSYLPLYEQLLSIYIYISHLQLYEQLLTTLWRSFKHNIYIYIYIYTHLPLYEQLWNSEKETAKNIFQVLSGWGVGLLPPSIYIFPM